MITWHKATIKSGMLSVILLTLPASTLLAQSKPSESKAFVDSALNTIVETFSKEIPGSCNQLTVKS